MSTKKRLESLDILRGLDMWFLLMVGPIVHAFLKCIKNPSWTGPAFDGLRHQMQHVKWEGFVVWDLIMPLFLFMAGVAIPFALEKYRSAVHKSDGSAESPVSVKSFYRKLARRVFLLFFLGWIVQGNLLTFEPRLFHPFANTLQAIAVGYLFSALAFVHFSPKGQIAFCVALFAAYFLVFLIPGRMNFDPADNIAMRIDKWVLGMHRDGVKFEGGDAWHFSSGYNYTWILSSLNFIVTVMLGVFSGKILKGDATSKKAIQLAVFGILLTVSGLALSGAMPIIKKIWSSSMTLFSGGLCCLLLSLLYYLVDVRGWKRGLGWLKYYGMNSILAYCIGEFVLLDSVSNCFLAGFAQWTGIFQPVVIAAGNALLLFFLLRFLYKREIFLRV